MYKAIVVGTDGSDTAKRAVAAAAELAKDQGSVLHVVLAYEPLRGTKIVGAPEGAAKVWAVPPDAKAQAAIDDAVGAVKLEGIEVKAHMFDGDPVDALIDVASGEGADLIVVGSQGLHGVKRLFGSVPGKVTHRARCSVLIVATDED